MNTDDNCRILLVDDLPSIHEDIRKVLQPPWAADDALASIEIGLLGASAPSQCPSRPAFELDSAYQGEQALTIAQAALAAGRPYALAFIDMRMPLGWDGVETIERLWQIDPRLQVVICTAFAKCAWSALLAKLDCGDRLVILKKPFDPVEVLQLANALTAKWSLARQSEAYAGRLKAEVTERTRELRALTDSLRAEIGQRREIERCLRTYAEVIRCTGEAIAITDLAGDVVEVNPAYEHAVGRTGDELIGTRVYGLDFSSAAARDLWRAVERDGVWSGEVLDRRRDGELFASLVQINAVPGEDGRRSHYVCVSRDITAAKQSEQQLLRLAFYDPLTELPNRALFNDRLQVALAAAKRQATLVGVMYVDLDQFKDVNDSLGHQAGDRLLVEVGQRITRCVRAVDTVARMGGDDFTVLLAQLTDKAEAEEIARRIIGLLREPIRLSDHQVHIGASIGISVYPLHGSDADTLQRYADMAMYEAKNAGRGQLRIYSDAMAARSNARLCLGTAVAEALDSNDFGLAYQPIVNAETGKTDKVEALIRWVGPDGRRIPPSTFIPIAEQIGLIRRIDQWVLEHACADAAAWQAEGHSAGVCVNLSALTVQSDDLAALVAHALERSGLAPSQLTIEITETAVVADPDMARRALDSVMSLGVAVAVDDFGTGYASLSYLTMFPINGIKLDRSFVSRIGKDAASEEVIRSMLELARKLRLDVVAEGVEDAGQEHFLAHAGCGHLQGYLMARPMNSAQLREWFDGRRGAQRYVIWRDTTTFQTQL